MDPVRMAARIQNCAVLYRDQLLDRRVLFVPASGAPPFECLFRDDNFMHLCGVSYGDYRPGRFFHIAATGRLDADMLHATEGANTIRKLASLPVLCRIDAKASAAVLDPVNHQGTRADLFCSNADACIGFVRTGDVYRPKTALAYDPPRSEPGYVNLIAAVKTEPGSDRYTIVSKEPKRRDKTPAKHAAIIRSLRAHPRPGSVETLLSHGF